MPELFIHRSRIEAPAAEVFRWHALPGALERLTPPWEPVEFVERTGGIEQIGSRVVLRLCLGPFHRTWTSEHTHYEDGRMFRDVQVAGPFARWEHTHTVEPDGSDACFLEDRIIYELPFGFLGKLLGGWFVRRKLERLFDYRHRVTAQATARREARG